MPKSPPRAGCAQQEDAALQNTASSVNPLGGFELDTFYRGGRVPSTREYIARAHAESHAQYVAAIEILDELGGFDDHPSMREMQARTAHDMLRDAAAASGKLIGCLLRFREFTSGIFPAGDGIWERQEQAGVLLFDLDLTFRRALGVCPVRRDGSRFVSCDHRDRPGCLQSSSPSWAIRGESEYGAGHPLAQKRVWGDHGKMVWTL